MSAQASVCKIALIGNPNCGKTTLFNRLTGAQQTTGNWPGVTVEQKTGSFKLKEHRYHLTDLPGVYSLNPAHPSGLDEKIACDFLQAQSVDWILNVVDATCLERQLFLTAQLLHMGLPVILVLNRMDLLPEHHLAVDVDKLAAQLKCPVVAISAYHNKGIEQLKRQLAQAHPPQNTLQFTLPEPLQDSLQNLNQQIPLLALNHTASCWQTLQYLLEPNLAPQTVQSAFQQEKQRLETLYQEDLALISADLYFQFAHDAAQASQMHTDRFTRSTTDAIDHWVLHPIWGLPIFFVVMYLLFAGSIAIGNLFIDWFDLSAQALFVDGPKVLLHQIGAPDWLSHLLAEGLGGGLHVVATFIPVIGALYLLLSLLEDTGYMQRAALMMDQFMRRLGLSGQAFVPLVIGFGCNIPAVMASRILPSPADRIRTVMMTPYMSCSARLTVYVLFASAFFETHAALMVFSLYVIGILAAVLTAWLLKQTLIRDEAQPLLMELPIYHKPTLMNVLINSRNRLRSFIVNAGKVIVLVVLVLNLLNSLGTDGQFGHTNQESSVLSVLAQSATPIVEPLGIREENWPATVGLFTGLLAKEVVVGSLDALYQQAVPAAPETFNLWQRLSAAAQTVPENLRQLGSSLIDPLGLAAIESVANQHLVAETQGVSLSTLDKMVTAFDGSVGAYAYLLLILLYFPCVATFAAIKQELGWRWALASGGWSLFLGYAVAVSFYQTATFNQHPESSAFWLGLFTLLFALLWTLLRAVGRHPAWNRTYSPLATQKRKKPE
ncbi:MAG: Fe(2+) transporter permease subunit FeoB [Thiotrichales bacterium]|nr:Fe(2+) transporter permease subunit FeoB [Thiotrichales bacterium]